MPRKHNKERSAGLLQGKVALRSVGPKDHDGILAPGHLRTAKKGGVLRETFGETALELVLNAATKPNQDILSGKADRLCAGRWYCRGTTAAQMQSYHMGVSRRVERFCSLQLVQRTEISKKKRISRRQSCLKLHPQKVVNLIQ